MKKRFVLLLALALLFAALWTGSASAATSGSCGTGVTYEIENDNGYYTLYIRGSGSISNYSAASRTPWYAYRSQINDIDIASGVTGIGNYAFASLTNITSVTLPDSVTRVGNYAFVNDTKLMWVKFGTGVTAIGDRAFSGCSMLDQYRCPLPSGLTSLGEYAFYGTAITTVNVPGGVTALNNSAFRNCTDLMSVTLNEGLLTIGDNVFFGCGSLTSLIIPEGVTTIGNSAFRNCTDLLSVTLNEGLLTIGDNAFSGCDSLTSLTIPEGVTTIGSGAMNPFSLKTIVLPDSITSCATDAMSKPQSVTLGSYFVTNGNRLEAFFNTFGDASTNGLKYITFLPSVTSLPEGTQIYNGRGSLTSITFQGPLESIPNSAFTECTALTTVNVPNGLKSIGEYAFYGCTNLRSFKLPNSLETIGNHAFEACSNYAPSLPEGLQSIGNQAFISTGFRILTLPSTLRTLGTQAFAYCRSLSSLTIREGIEIISNQAFFECDALTGVVLPASVRRLGGSSFSYCDKLASVTFKGSSVELSGHDLYGDPLLTTLIFVGDNYSFGESWISPDIGAKALVWADSSAYDACVAAGLVTVACPAGVEMTDVIEFGACGESASYVVAGDHTLRVSGTGAIQDYAFTPSYSSQHVTDQGRTYTALIIDEGITHVGMYGFYDCDNIAAITLPDSLQSTDKEAFSSIDQLTSITLPEHDLTLGDHFLFAAYSLESIHLPDSLTVLPDSMFSGAPILKEVNIPQNLKKIEPWAFSSCKLMTDFDLPEGLEEIGYGAFSSSGLTSLTIPSTIQTLGSRIFRYCSSLQEIIFAGPVPQAALEENFDFTESTSTPTIYLPHGTPSWTGENLGTKIIQYYCPEDKENRVDFAPARMEAAAPGCVAAGNSEYWYCPVCGTVFADETLATTAAAEDFTLTPTGHSYGSEPLFAFSQDGASCDVIFTCGLCGNELTVAAQVSAESVLEPTCARMGATRYIARLDVAEGNENGLPAGIYTDSTELTDLPMLKHTPVVGSEGYPPTCTEDGLTDYIFCSVCGETLRDSNELPALGHLSEVSEPAEPPTCIQPGHTEEYACARCHAVLIPATVVPALGHRYEAPVFDWEEDRSACAIVFTCIQCEGVLTLDATVSKQITLSPTCTEDGTVVYTASAVLAGESYTNTLQPKTVPALGHTPTAVPAVAPSDRLTGLTEGSYCAICGAVLTPQEVVPALWSYTEDGLTVIAYNGSETEVTIPEGVTALGAELFKNNTAVTVVRIPGAVETVGATTFFGATAITDIYFPDQLAGLKPNTLYNVPANARLHANLGSVPAVALSYYNRCFVNPEGWTLRYKTRAATEAPTEVYVLCVPAAEEITIPAEMAGVPVTQLHAGAVGEEALVVHLPAGLTTIQDGALAGTPTVYSAWDAPARLWAQAAGLAWAHEQHTEEPIPAVPATRTQPGAIAGVRCAECGEVLTAPVEAPALGDSDLMLPAQLTRIGDEAFQGLPIRVLWLPEGLESVGSEAFADCADLRQVFIPDDIGEISANAFTRCHAALIVYGHTGSAAETFARDAGLPFCPAEENQ